MALNPRQQQALEYIDGACLVLAGAGSGKTSVITQKIAHLIKKGTPAHKIVAVTFTNKAAREMKERVGKLLKNDEKKGLTVCTFHQFGLQFLRYELKYTGLKANFSIMDSDDAKRLLSELMQKDNLAGSESKDILATAIARISNYKNDMISPDDAMINAHDKEEQYMVSLYALYERHLRAYNAVDFDDLIGLPVKLLRENKDLRDKWQMRISYLLVDEYQDTNTAQYELIKALVGNRPRFTVVGDDDQSIYAWRGARPENMAQLGKDFDLTVVKLEQNYRSTNRILSAANAVIGNNAHLYDKKLWSDRGDGDKIVIMPCTSDFDEAQKIAKEIVFRRLQSGAKWSDFAVLYRSNFQARLLETELRALGAPYKMSGGTSFFAKSEIKDVMGYLRLIVNPDDDPAFLRVINTPKRGIGSATLEKLGLFAGQAGISLLSACSHGALDEAVGARAGKILSQFANMIAHFTQALYQNDDPMPLVRQMINDTDYLAELESISKTPHQFKSRVDNIETLYTSIQKQIERSDDEKTLDSAIRSLMLLDMLEQKNDEDDTDRVSLSTLHAAKGLEYNNVYLIGAEEDILPHKNSIVANQIEEERRLMYVGITRARHHLTISYAKTRKLGGQSKTTTHSRFLDELPHAHIIWAGKVIGDDNKTISKKGIENLMALLDMD